MYARWARKHYRLQHFLPGDRAFGVRLQINNLTDEPLRITRDNNENRLGSYDVYGRRALLDFSYRF